MTHNNLRVALAMLIASAIIVSACGPASSPSQIPASTSSPPIGISETTETLIDAETGGIVELSDGARVVIPDGALTDDQIVLLARSTSEPLGGNQTLFLPGNVYEVRATQDTFDVPIRITIPYDEELIPPDRTEREIFAVFYHDGEWRRVYGDVDIEANTITVEVLHASIWTWAADRYANAIDAIKRLFGASETCKIPATEQEAIALVEQRRREWRQTVQEANFVVEELEAAMSLQEVASRYGRLAAEEIATRTTEAVILKLAGKAALLKIGGVFALYWAGPIAGALYLFDVSQKSGAVMAEIYRVERAFDQLREAEAVLYVLQNRGVQTMPPELAKALESATERCLIAGKLIGFSGTILAHREADALLAGESWTIQLMEPVEVPYGGGSIVTVLGFANSVASGQVDPGLQVGDTVEVLAVMSTGLDSLLTLYESPHAYIHRLNKASSTQTPTSQLPTQAPTHTPMPTWTPVPRVTPMPTPMPMPTPTPESAWGVVHFLGVAVEQRYGATAGADLPWIINVLQQYSGPMIAPQVEVKGRIYGDPGPWGTVDPELTPGDMVEVVASVGNPMRRLELRGLHTYIEVIEHAQPTSTPTAQPFQPDVHFLGQALSYQTIGVPPSAIYWTIDVVQKYAGPPIASQVRVVIFSEHADPVVGYVDPNLMAGDMVEVRAFSTDEPNWLALYGSEQTYIRVISQNPPEEPSPTPSDVSPAMTIDPSVGPVGTRHYVVISGFQPNESILIEMIREVTGEAVLQTGGAANSSGLVQFSFYFESSDPPGSYRLVATGASGVRATASVTLQP